MNHYTKYCAGGPGCFSTYNPLFVGCGKTHVYRGEFWENEFFVGAWNIPEINICESNVCNHGGYIEVYPLYPNTYTTASLNSLTYGVATFEREREEELKEAGFYHIHSDGGYTDFRVPSLILTRSQSKTLMKGIMAEIENEEKDDFSSFKSYLKLVNGDEVITVLDCGNKMHEVLEGDLGDSHFEFVLQFADQELRLSYTNEQSRLLIECLK
jgi:hypothetical protein